MENQNADVKIVLEEMRRQFDQVLRTGELLDQKAGAFLVAAGALIVVAMSRQAAPLSSWAAVVAVLLAFLYAAAFVLVLFSITTRGYNLPLDTDWEEIDRRLFNETERDANLIMISGYVTQIDFNRRINRRKARFVDLGLWLLMATVILILILVLLQ